MNDMQIKDSSWVVHISLLTSGKLSILRDYLQKNYNILIEMCSNLTNVKHTLIKWRTKHANHLNRPYICLKQYLRRRGFKESYQSSLEDAGMMLKKQILENFRVRPYKNEWPAIFIKRMKNTYAMRYYFLELPFKIPLKIKPIYSTRS
jgi:hypothetical protein